MFSSYKRCSDSRHFLGSFLSIALVATSVFFPVPSSTRTLRPIVSSSPAMGSTARSPEVHSSLALANPLVSEPEERTHRVNETYGRLPLSFEINEGQTDSEVEFISRSAGYNLFLTASESVMVLSKSVPRKANKEPNTAREKEQTTPKAVLRMKLVGSNKQPRMIGLDELPGKSNYFIGNDPKKWQVNVSNYARVKYESVYPGIDMVYHGDQQRLEYDFIVAPNADSSVVRLDFEGATRLHIEVNGDLVITMRDGTVRQHRPVAYQVFDGRRREVECRYVKVGKRQVAMKIGGYDRRRELVIDPIITYSTFLGGSGGESAWGLDVDADGNAYVTGPTSSTNFPIRNSIQSYGGGTDTFVTKINASGSATVFSTYIGGSAFEAGESIRIDASGSAYVTGSTQSTNFPTLNPFQSSTGGNSDAFVLKLSATGDALVYSTYLGGNGADLGYDIDVDEAGSAYVTGSVESSNFPTVNPFDSSYNSPELEDAFITKLNPAGNALVYSTFLGGGLYDEGHGITVDTLGNAYVTGFSSSTNFPTVAALFPNISSNEFENPRDAFVTKINPTGNTLVFSTFLGGPDSDTGEDIALDSPGNIYVTGKAGSGFPIVNAYQPTMAGYYDAFVTKIDPTATSIIFSTFLGGAAQDSGTAIAVDSNENIFIAGYTLSTDFPKVRSLQGSYGGGPGDFLIAKFNAAGTLSFSTSLGTISDDVAYGIALDASSNAYVAGKTGSSSFPTVGSLQPYGGNGDAIVLKIGGLLSYNVTGRVTDALNVGLSAVTVTLSGSQSATTQTDINGNYILADVPSGGNYTVTPAKSPYTFIPTNQSFIGLNANQTADFTVATHSINGTVTGAGGAPTSGVTIVLSGTQANTTETDSNGNYNFPSVAKGGNYTVTPSKLDPILTYTFTPGGQTINSLATNQIINFSSSTSIVSAMNSTADAYVQDGTAANSNFGLASSLRVETNSKTNNSKNFDAYLKFDVSGIAANITAAKLRILASSSTAAGATTSVYSVSNTSWVESGAGGITWNNKPARSATALAGSSATINTTTFSSYDLDVTAYVRSEKYAGRDLISFALHNPSASTVFVTLNSREAAANKPQLIVTTSSSANTAPSVALANPLGGASFTAPANILVSANATDSDGTISKVEFYAGTTLIGTATAAPYQITWGPVSEGSYSLTAVATDSSSSATVSAPVAISVNPPNIAPSVTLDSPIDGTIFSAGSNIPLSATASDLDGTISKVEFFAGALLIGTATVPAAGAVYNVTWTNVNSGAYTLTAKATDNVSGTTTSSVVNINVVSQTGLSPIADAYVRDGASATTNFGTANELQTLVSTVGSNRETYLKFDITTVSGIVNAKLRLYGRLSDTSGNNVPAAVYPVLTSAPDWTESGNGSITWNNKPGTGPALTSVTVIDNNARWYEWNIADYVKAEKDAGRNIIKLAIKNTASSTPYATFNSKEADSNRPQLILWTTQARNALLVANSTTLGVGDNAIKTRLQNQGYTVTVKGSGNNNAIQTSDANGKTVVLISSTVTSANVSAKFRHVPIPVIIWKSDLFDDQGMTGSTLNTDFGTAAGQTQVAIVNSIHPLAAGLTASPTVSASSSFTWGNPNANAARIATLVGDATKFVIFGYENTATMVGPTLDAPARRMGFFLTDLTANGLTTEGNLLFDAAVKWATELVTTPFISSITPSIGLAGTQVSINGANFGSQQGTSAVTFNGASATVSSWDHTSVIVTVPAFATTGPVVITINGVASNAVIFSVAGPDSDSDGLLDSWELQYFGNLNQSANGDPDGDGLTNLQEFQQGRNPTKSALADDGDFVNLKLYKPLSPPLP